MRKFFIQNNVPLEVLEEMFRMKKQRQYLGKYEELARLLNQSRVKKGSKPTKGTGSR